MRKIIFLYLFFIFPELARANSCEDLSLNMSTHVYHLLHDFYEGSLEGFKLLHKNGGFLTYGDRILFIAPQKISTELMAEHLGLASANHVAIRELKDWHGIDVTTSSYFSNYTRELHGRRSLYDADSRCYSAVLYAAGFTKGIINSSSQSMQFYFSSPFMREIPFDNAISGKIEIKKGDIIAVGTRGEKYPVDHVAIFETNQVLFQKVSPMVETPFNIVTLDSFLRQYPAGEFRHRIFRAEKSFDHFLQENQNILTPQMRSFLDILYTNQIKIAKFSLNERRQPGYPDNFKSLEAENKFFEKYQDLIVEIRKTSYEIEDIAIKKIEESPKGSTTEYLWRYIYLLSSDATTSSGPFE